MASLAGPQERKVHGLLAGQKDYAFAQVNVTLIVLFNYYYTFLQLDPKDMADQLKRAGGAIPAVRPGRATADYITKTLNRMSILGSAFLGALAAAPPLVETVTGLQVGAACPRCLSMSPSAGSGLGCSPDRCALLSWQPPSPETWPRLNVRCRKGKLRWCRMLRGTRDAVNA